MSTTTITYKVNPTGGQTALQMAGTMNAAQAQIDASLITDVYGAVILSWHAIVVGAQAVLTIVVTTTGSNVVGLTEAFLDLFTADLRAILLQPDLAATPINAP